MNAEEKRARAQSFREASETSNERVAGTLAAWAADLEVRANAEEAGAE